jgi:uncharacterized cupredoxin-like copper-binding protein
MAGGTEKTGVFRQGVTQPVREKENVRKKTIVSIMAILSVAALSLAACSGKSSARPTQAPVTEVHVKLTEFKVDLDKTSIPAGPVKFVIVNAGTLVHEIVLEPAGATDQPWEANGKVAEAEDIEVGQSATLEWTLDTPGEYQLGCHVPGHYEAGMVATFTATAP